MEVMTNGRDKYRSRENRRLVRELFMRDWDPIGVGDIPHAQNEYDGYVAKAYVMLVDEMATVDDLARYLVSAEEYMGFTTTMRSAERCRRVAEAFVALKPSLVTTH
jgi:hypothetical protein